MPTFQLSPEAVVYLQYSVQVVSGAESNLGYYRLMLIASRRRLLLRAVLGAVVALFRVRCVRYERADPFAITSRQEGTQSAV